MEDKNMLIWKKIDGGLTPSEQKEFDHQMTIDESFRKEYLFHKNLNSVLYKVPMKKAPRKIKENVLSKVSVSNKISSKRYVKEFGSFNGFGKLAIGFIGFSIVSIILAIVFDSSPQSVNTSYPIYDWLNNISIDSSFLENLSNNSSVVISLACLAALVWFDYIFRYNTRIVRH